MALGVPERVDDVLEPGGQRPPGQEQGQQQPADRRQGEREVGASDRPAREVGVFHALDDEAVEQVDDQGVGAHPREPPACAGHESEERERPQGSDREHGQPDHHGLGVADVHLVVAGAVVQPLGGRDPVGVAGEHRDADEDHDGGDLDPAARATARGARGWPSARGRRTAAARTPAPGRGCRPARARPAGSARSRPRPRPTSAGRSASSAARRTAPRGTTAASEGRRRGPRGSPRRRAPGTARTRTRRSGTARPPCGTAARTAVGCRRTRARGSR